MSASVVREALGTLAIGFFLWEYFRYTHRLTSQNNRSGYYFLTVPFWLTTICGHPLPNSKLELSHALGQIGGLLLGVVWLPMYWLGLERSQRFNVFAVCTVGVLMFPMMAYAIVTVYRRLDTDI